MLRVKVDGVELAVPQGAAVRFALASAVLGFAAVPSAAADKQPPLIPSWKQSHLEVGDPTVRSVYLMAICTRNHRREAAIDLLATAPGSSEEASQMRNAIPSGQTECPIRVTRLRINGGSMLMRGALAEALYNGDRTKPRAASPLPLAQTPGSPVRGSAAVGRWVAQCAVRRRPVEAHAVLKDIPGSIGEERALRGLKPTFLSCLPPGERLSVSRILIRALIAEELYHASVSFKESFANAKG